jgi:hypothetical protein
MRAAVRYMGTSWRLLVAILLRRVVTVGLAGRVNRLEAIAGLRLIPLGLAES